MKYGVERSQSRKQAKISLYNRAYVHQKENMPANATLRPECKHFQSHRSPKEPLSYKVTTSYMQCSVCFTHKRIHSICCKYQTHLQYMQKLECKCYIPYI